jgi:hypothetical protein
VFLPRPQALPLLLGKGRSRGEGDAPGKPNNIQNTWRLLIVTITRHALNMMNQQLLHSYNIELYLGAIIKKEGIHDGTFRVHEERFKHTQAG